MKPPRARAIYPLVIHIVKIEPDPHGVTIFYATEIRPRRKLKGPDLEFRKGKSLLETLPPDDEPLGPCGGAWMIGSAEATSGWGPMLYDVAMEYATMNGGGLIVADRGYCFWTVCTQSVGLLYEQPWRCHRYSDGRS